MTKLELAKKIDHTLLKPDATAAQIEKLCQEAVSHHFCSVCVNSGRAAQAKKAIAGSDVKLCVVVGFPLGCSVSKAQEAKAMAQLGVDEIDMVLDIGRAKDGDWDAVEADIRAVREACQEPGAQSDSGGLSADRGGDRSSLPGRRGMPGRISSRPPRAFPPEAPRQKMWF